MKGLQCRAGAGGGDAIVRACFGGRRMDRHRGLGVACKSLIQAAGAFAFRPYGNTSGVSAGALRVRLQGAWIASCCSNMTFDRAQAAPQGPTRNPESRRGRSRRRRRRRHCCRHAGERMIPPHHKPGERLPPEDGKTHKERLLEGGRARVSCVCVHVHACSAAAAAAHRAPSTPAATPSLSCSAGEPYNAEDPELTDDRIACRRLLHKLNVGLEYDDVEGRRAVLRQLLGSYDEGEAGCTEHRRALCAPGAGWPRGGAALLRGGGAVCPRPRGPDGPAAARPPPPPDTCPGAPCSSFQSPRPGSSRRSGRTTGTTSTWARGEPRGPAAGAAACARGEPAPARPGPARRAAAPWRPPNAPAPPAPHPPPSAPPSFYCNFNCVMLDCGPIRIGDRVLLGPAVQVRGASR